MGAFPTPILHHTFFRNKHHYCRNNVICDRLALEYLSVFLCVAYGVSSLDVFD